MMNGIIDLGIWQMLSAYIFVLIVVWIVWSRRIGREKEILISAVRMTVQLIAVGYILAYIFEHANPIYTFAVLAVMEIFAVYNAYQRIKVKLNTRLRKIIAVSLVLGTMGSLLFFVLGVVRVKPWYNPQYFIPLGGMIIGNSMTGITLGTDRVLDGMRTRKEQIEMALMLGATPKMAAKQVGDSAFETAILPTVNQMMGMGIVFLPGMMTGQILSGTSPLTAIEYQIAIMLGILGSVSLSVILFVIWSYRAFFNERAQLVDD